MPLKIDKKTSLVLLDKAVDASGVRFGENVIAIFRKSAFTHLIPSRMRDSQALRNVLQQRMTRHPGLIEDPNAFVSQWVTFDSIQVEDRAVNRQTRANGRKRILLGPVDHADERGPIRFIHQPVGRRFCARYDESIKVALKQVIDALIKSTHIIASPVAARRRIHRIQVELDNELSGCTTQQVK